MCTRARREARRIATTPCGDAFESVDFEGEGDAGILLLHGLCGTPDDLETLSESHWRSETLLPKTSISILKMRQRNNVKHCYT